MCKKDKYADISNARAEKKAEKKINIRKKMECNRK